MIARRDIVVRTIVLVVVVVVVVVTTFAVVFLNMFEWNSAFRTCSFILPRRAMPKDVAAFYDDFRYYIYSMSCSTPWPVDAVKTTAKVALFALLARGE